jgi:heme/copper-type cytochrome/quinol oxidase subunit 2
MLCSKKSTDPNLGVEARFQMLEMALKIELLPRVMWVMALPFGVQLSKTMGYIDPSSITLTMMWLFTLAWLVINVGGAANLNEPWGQQLSKINRFIVASLGVGLIIVAVSSFMGYGPYEANSVALKVGLYGLVNLTILGIEIAFFPLGLAYERLATEGSSPEIESSISGGMDLTLRWVHATYILIFITAFIGATKIVG